VNFNPLPLCLRGTKINLSKAFACHCAAAENATVRKADGVKSLIEAWDLLEVAVTEKG
jgi:hypothetical protein